MKSLISSHRHQSNMHHRNLSNFLKGLGAR